MIQETPMPMPPWTVSQWFNTSAPLTLEGLRGRIVVVHAFQMLCPGCVAHGLPQAQAVQRRFAGDDLIVVGLHTVFEHHEAMTPVALAAFLHEYRVDFPVGVDAPSADGRDMPTTMRAWGMRGTPTLIVIDRTGRLRSHSFGQVEDMLLGALIGRLLVEPVGPVEEEGTAASSG